LANAGVVRFTVADRHIAELWASVLPNLTLLDRATVARGSSLAWAVRKESPELLGSLDDFIRSNRKGTLLGNILFKRYYQNAKFVRNPTAREEREKLERVAGLFQKYSETYGFDWLMVAAQAYQESGLDHTRKSHVGAVGIMQIMPRTAADKNVGIPDIRSLENNIHAGTKYLAFLRDRYFSSAELGPKEKHFFSMAAYNAGPARVRQFRKRAESMGLDPNKWFRNVERAALEIVGQETVRYVANIYKYYVAYSLVADSLQRRRPGASAGQ
jgi:membrane-bound lytic murein transglycosylase MltF